MAYDRYDREHSRWSDDDRHGGGRRDWERGRTEYSRDQGRANYGERHGGHDERGFFERAGEEIASWFGGGDDHHEHGRHRDEGHRGDRSRGGWQDESRMRHRDEGMRSERSGGWGGERDRSDERFRGGGQRESYRSQQNRGVFARGGSSERDYNPGWRGALWGDDRGHESDRHRGGGRDDYRESSRGYRPMTGDYGRGSHASEEFFAASGVGRGEPAWGDYDRQRRGSGRSNWDQDEYRSTSRAGTSDRSDRSRETGYDPHYRSWRDRHMDDLDRDYHDYRREHQSKFEDDFGSWRDKRQQKRGLLSQIREHMEVIGSDGEHVGTVDKVAGDRLILTKSDPASGGAHHSLSCSEIDRVEDNRVMLDCSAAQARQRWRDEDRGRALFERHDQGEMGPHILDRSFEGTYR